MMIDTSVSFVTYSCHSSIPFLISSLHPPSKSPTLSSCGPILVFPNGLQSHQFQLKVKRQEGARMGRKGNYISHSAKFEVFHAPDADVNRCQED